MKMTNKEHKSMYELRTLIVKYGYWSNEVKEFNDSLDYKTMTKINNIIKNEKDIIQWEKSPKEYAEELFNKMFVQKFSEISGWYIDYQETIENCLVVIHTALSNIAVIDIKHPLYEYWQEIETEINKIQY